MKQRYNDLTHELIVRAVLNCFNGKWRRNDVLSIVEEYGGIPREEITRQSKDSDMTAKLEAVENIAFEVENRMEAMKRGRENPLELEEIKVRKRKDGLSGKVREIAYECIFHQIFNHLAYLGMEPLFHAKILHWQYASIPGRGQTGLKNRIKKALQEHGGKIRYAIKTDVKSAYQSTNYEDIILIIEKEIPSATWILLLLRELSKMSKTGNLIIGGYLDAWMFNFLMSYAMRKALGFEKVKRGKRERYIKMIVSFMDDFCFLGTRRADVKSAVRKTVEFMEKEMGFTVKTGKESKLPSFGEEREKGREERPGRRGTESIDMGGYVVHRGYVSIRKRIYKRIRRQYLRAKREIERTGTVVLKRAQTLLSYYGYFLQASAEKAKKALCVEEICKIAKGVVKYHGKNCRNRQTA